MATPLLKTVLHAPASDGFSRQLTVIELGANLIDDSRGPGYAKNSIAGMIKTVQAARNGCLWIGPPKMRRFGDAKVDQMYVIIADAIALAAQSLPAGTEPCTLFDSRPLTDYPATGGDGVHYSFPAGIPIAKAWGARAAAAVAASLTAP